MEERKKAREEVNWVTEDEEEFMYSLEGPRIEKNNMLLSWDTDPKIIIIWLYVSISVEAVGGQESLGWGCYCVCVTVELVSSACHSQCTHSPKVSPH